MTKPVPEHTMRDARGATARILFCILLLLASPLAAQTGGTVPCTSEEAPGDAGQILAGDSALARCRAVRSQQEADRDEDKSFSVPESPAFTFLNTSPAEITRPSSPREFAAALVNGVNGQGQVQQGFALEFSPFPVIPGFIVPLRDYQSSFLKRAAYRTQISLGTVRAQGDSSSTDIAMGIRTTLFDDADPMASRRYTDSLSNRMLDCIPKTPTDDPNEGLSCIEDAIDATRQISADWLERWNSRRLIVAFAFGQRFVNSNPHTREGLGWRAWALGSNPLGSWGILLGYVEVGRRLAVAGSPGFGSFRYGGRTVLGSSTLNGFLEVIGESRFDAAARTKSGGTSWSAGLEVRATEGIWLSTGFGQRFAEAKAPDRLVVIANLRLGLSKGARFSDLQRNQFESN